MATDGSAVQPPAGIVAHSCAGRTRLNFPELRNQAIALEALREKVLQLSGVVDAEIRPVTGSLIMAHWGTAEDLVAEAQRVKLFSIVSKEGGESIERRASSLASQLDAYTNSVMGAGLDLRSMAALAFAVMAIRQLAKGVIAPPAATAIWSAVILLLAEKGISKLTEARGPMAD